MPGNRYVKTEAAPRSPQVVGKVERVNSIFGSMLRLRLAGKDTSHWHRELNMCEIACRAYATPELLISSYELVYGTPYRFDVDVGLISFHNACFLSWTHFCVFFYVFLAFFCCNNMA